MCANTCHPLADRPHASAVPDWARRHPLAAVPGGVAEAPTDRDGVPARSAGVAGAGPATVSARPPVVDTVGPPVVDALHVRALALAVCVDVLLAELAAERRRRRAIVDRYEYVLERREAHPPEGTGEDEGNPGRIREWFTG